MQGNKTSSFEACVRAQVDLLNAGKPLEAFDIFFAPSGQMFANDKLFANDAREGREKQEPYITAATSISGSITDLKFLVSDEICVFRNRSSFIASANLQQIDGLCWQRWHDSQIVEERYYDGDPMRELIADGVLRRPQLIAHRLAQLS